MGKILHRIPHPKQLPVHREAQDEPEGAHQTAPRGGSTRAGTWHLESEDLQRLLDRLPSGVAVVDEQRRLRWVNEPMRQINGAPSRAQVDRDGQESISADVAQAVDEAVQKVLTTGQPVRRVLVRGKTPANLEVRTWLCDFLPVTLSSGRGVMTVVNDVMGDVAAPASPDPGTSLRLLVDVFDSLPMHVAICDANGIVRHLNRSATEAAGPDASDAIGRPLQDGLWWSKKPSMRRRIARAVMDARAGKLAHFDTEADLEDGRATNVELTIVPLRDAAGSVDHLVTCAVDVTSRNRVQQRLERAIRAAKADRDRARCDEATRMRWLAELSHELRGPMTPLLAELEYVDSDPDLPGHLRDSVACMRRSAGQMQRMIDDLFDLNRALHGKLTLDRRPVDVHALITNLAEEAADEISRAGLQFQLDLAAPDAQVLADSLRLRQVLWNLLSNAIKFTPGDGLVRIVTRRIERDGRPWLEVMVRDTGIGIDPAELPELFTPFRQLHSQEEAGKRTGGMGLGLSICHQIVTAHEGQLTARSDGTGRGSTFTVSLPT